MTDLYDIELWNAEGTKSDSRVVNSTELGKVVRDFKTFVTWSSLSIVKKPKKDESEYGTDEVDQSPSRLRQRRNRHDPRRRL